MTNEDIEHDLLKMIDNIDKLQQGIINLNYKLNQHIKEGHATNGQTTSDTGTDTYNAGIGNNNMGSD